MQDPKTPGVVLAGGQSRRMGGGDKALLVLGKKRLLEHVLARLAPQVERLAINANGDVSRFSAFDYSVLPDPIPGFPGPLAGVLAAMDWAHSLGARSVATVAADTPFFPADLVERLGKAQNPDGIAIAATGTGTALDWHPTFGLWPVDLRHALRRDVLAGQRKVIAWALQNKAVAVLFDQKDEAFFNINTPEDLLVAQQRHDV